MDPVVQEVLKSQYRLQLVRRIGRGGFGEVWEATTAEGVPCALKISLDPLDWGNPGIERELENLELIKNLAGHPHVVSLQDFWQIHGYLVTRWELAEDSLEGILRQYRQQGKEGIPLELLLQFVADAAQGIDFLNSRGIVHRDIKPSNLLVFFGRVKVGDLGLAKLVGASTGSHTGAGTLGYLPPEAYGLGPDEKGRLSPTVDLYGLAASYVKLRTGQEPFGEHPAEIVERQKAGRPLVDTLTPAEKVVVLRALSPRPEDRPQEGAAAWAKILSQAALEQEAPAGWLSPQTNDVEVSSPPAKSRSQPPASSKQRFFPGISVDPWGKGDVQTLAEAVEQVEENGIIRLAAATHYLEKPLELTRPVRLIGEGMDRTEVICDGPGYVLKYSGSGRFVASGITFKHTGKAPAHVVVISDGEIDLESCRFTGAVLDPRTNEGGCGLLISGSSKGYVKECHALHNEASGITVADHAQPTLEWNRSEENGRSGITYSGFASGLAVKNTCSGNGQAGIFVFDRACPSLSQNRCLNNLGWGILWHGALFRGAIRQNTVVGNQAGGINCHGCYMAVLVGLAVAFGGKLVWNAIWEAVIRFWS